MQGGGDSVNTAKRKEKQKEIAKLHEKTFRAWINKQLKKKNLHIENLFTDLEDGTMLIKIFETLSGKTCTQKPTPNPKMEIQKLENITMGLEFGKTLMPISMIQSKDIMEANKNPKLLLGLVWQMILHFQVLGEQDSADKKSQVEKQRGAKEKLLKWCQEQTKGHAHTEISDLTVKSWGDGMGFCALVHAYNPNLIDYNSLDPSKQKENLQKAFELAEKHMDIPQFLDAEDILSDNQPDEQCFITYLSEFPLAFLHKASKDLASGEAARLEAERKAKEDEEKRRREEEDRKRKEEEERLRREADDAKRREEDAKRREEDARRQAEEDRLRREAEEARKREEEARKAQEDADRKAEKKAKKAADAEAARLEAERKAREDEERRLREAAVNAEEDEKKKAAAEKAFEEEREKMRKENEAIRNQLEAVKKKLIGKIGVTVVEARGLPKSDHMSSKSDPYCVLFLERQKEKTRTVKKTLNPKWQAEFEFYVSDVNASLEVSVFDWNRIFSDELLGKVTIPVKEMHDGIVEDKWFPLVGKEGKKKDKEASGEIRLVLAYKLER